jgi:hypothetical protein
VLCHLLNRGTDTHLAASNINYGVNEIEVRELSIRSVINYMHRLEALLLGVVDSKSTLEGAGLERQRGHEIRVVGIMVCVYPSLCTCLAIGWKYEDDIFGPEGPACTR